MIEAMKQAFDKACEAMEAAGKRIDELKAENASLRQAIAEAEKQEPYGYLKLSNAKFFCEVEGVNPMRDKNYLPLYTSPPQRQWVGLTPEERSNCRYWACENFETFGRAIEAKLKEKNA